MAAPVSFSRWLAIDGRARLTGYLTHASAPRYGVPEPSGSVRAASDDALTVRAVGNRPDPGRMRLEGVDFLKDRTGDPDEAQQPVARFARPRSPQGNRTVVTAREHVLAV